VTEVAHALRAHVPGPRPPRYPTLGQVRGPEDVMPFDPVVGPLSPLAPPLRFTATEGRVVAEATFEIPYEGPPGCVHGGVIAAAFDQVLNVANLMAGLAGPTATLTVRYRRPTPLGEPVRFEAGTPAEGAGRVRTLGVLRARGEVTAEAAGEFVPMPLDRVMALSSGRR
jgi:acyl-coenzyme A thioesterase PaaI-like protein